MNWLEFIGLITVVSFGIFLFNRLTDQWESDKTRAALRRAENEKYRVEEQKKKEMHAKWEKANPEKAIKRKEEELRQQEANEEHLTRVDDLYDIKLELDFLEAADRRKKYEYVKEYRTSDPGEYWRTGRSVLPSSNSSLDSIEDTSELPWDDIQLPGPDEPTLSVKIPQIMNWYCLSEAEVASIYSFIQYDNENNPMKAKWAKLDRKGDHDFILNSQLTPMMRELKEIAEKRGVDPIYEL